MASISATKIHSRWRRFSSTPCWVVVAGLAGVVATPGAGAAMRVAVTLALLLAVLQVLLVAPALLLVVAAMTVAVVALLVAVAWASVAPNLQTS